MRITDLEDFSTNYNPSHFNDEVDIKEVDDRLQEMMVTLEYIEENQTGNQDIFKVNLTSFSEEKCKSLSYCIGY